MKTQNQTHLMPAFYIAVLSICLSVVATRPASAASDTWNGGAAPDGNWLTPGNWNGVTPATNDLLVFTGSTQTATTNNYSAGTPFNNVAFSSGASAFTLNGNSMILSAPTDAGSGQIAGGSINSASANTETIRLPIVLASGNHKISSSGAGTLKLNGSITHSNGAVVTMSGNINVTGGLSTNGNANGILGGWAVFNNAQYNWATLDASSNIVAYSGYTDVAGGGTIANNPASNVRIPVNGAAISTTAGTTAINSLFFGSTTASGANQVLNIGAGNTLVFGQNGGFFDSTSVAGAGTYRMLTIGSSVAAGGIVTAGDGVNPAQITLGSPPLPSGSAGFLIINSAITDNGSAPLSVTVAGAYCNLNGLNTHSGGTYILQGRVSQPTVNTFGYGPVYIVSGGQANPGTAITNDFYLEGSGTVESSGMGALRMFNGAILTGTIHLTANAVVGGNGNANILNGIRYGLAGKITGPGGLTIGSPTSTSSTGGGNIAIGKIDGTSTPNDYAGDTTISGTSGGTVSSVLVIAATNGDYNIMPHGSTGSYAGGKTGNLILNATAANRRAIFDLNGSTQTINGLSSTANSPANNFVASSNAPGTLIIGDNNATATYGGILQDGIGLSLTKIGTGTETLSGANTYTGDTVVKAGTLVMTTASTGGGNYSVSNNAALGVTTATLGGTLQVTNLTFGSSSAALNLNAGSLGDSSAAVVNVTGALNMNGNVPISLSGVGLTAGGPFTVLTYNPANRTGPGPFVLNNSPRIVATLNDDTVGNVTITITSADSAVKWNGGTAGNWDTNNTGNTIWQTVPSGNTTYYIEAGSGNDSVLFNDTLTGTNKVNLTTTLSPQAITVTNSARDYLFSGPGKLTGTTGLTKQGAGTLTIANSGNNDFSGDIALTAGTLVFSNSSSIANTISGGGALTKNGNGTLILSGNNTSFTGPVAVNGGTLTVLNGASLATVSGTTIANGAALDIGLNSVALGLTNITVSGSGVGGNGAIVNSSGYSLGAIATSFQTLTLAGNTTIGGPGRLDFRSSDPNGGSDATLSTGGNAYDLTKISGSILQLASVQIDSALANINVQAGILGIQGNMPSLGNPASTLTVSGGATLQFNSISSTMNKALVLQDGAIVNNTAGASTYGGPVTLQGTGIFNIAGSSATFTNALGGPGTLSKVTGSGAMYLNASNTYFGDTLINAGSLYLTEPGDISASRSISIGTGATLDVTGRTDQTLTLLGGHALTGGGTLNGNLTNLPASMVAPGTSTAIGTLTVNGNAILEGTTTLKLNATSVTSDTLTVNGNLNYGGALVVTNLTGSLAAGNTFQLFNGSITGGFTSITLPPLGIGLAWNTNALPSGTLSVSQMLTITNFTLSGTTLTFQGAGGTPFGNYVLLSSTNVTKPLNQWTPQVTNTFDGDGAFNFTTNIDASLSQQFYILSQ